MHELSFAPKNHVLRALPENEIASIRGDLTRVRLVPDQVVHEPGGPVSDVYFLEEGLASLTAYTADGGQVEVGMTGREGFLGTAALLNSRTVSVHRESVHLPGNAYRMRAEAFREAADRLPALRSRCLCHIQAVMVETAQLVACNVRHELGNRLARWLLLSRERAGSNDLRVTQEFMAGVLGVRRAGVSVVACLMQDRGMIRQSRGGVTILDVASLEAEACACYRIISESRREIMACESC